MSRARSYSRYSREALALLGKQIQAGRKERKWSAQELATRAGIARDTLQHIEKGDPGCAIGLVFEVAALVGVPLFFDDQSTTMMVRERARVEDKLALLPKAIRPKRYEVKDDF
jgi:DNA-binding XRE family transcriptional regulator